MHAPPEPHEIFERTREEGRRRLARPPLELGATAIVAGFDVVFGVTALAVVSALFTKRFGPDVARTVSCPRAPAGRSSGSRPTSTRTARSQPS